MDVKRKTEAGLISELRKSEAQLRQSVKAGNVGLWDWDLRTDRVFFSSEWKSQIGYEDHEVSDDLSEWKSRVHPDDIQRAMAAVKAFIANEIPAYAVEFRFRHKDGSYRWILAQASILLDEQGQPERMLGSHVDITERKRVEEALRASEERYRSVIEDQTEIISRFRPDGTFLFVNDVYCRLLGKPRVSRR